MITAHAALPSYNSRMQFSFVTFWTIVGAGIAFALAPAHMGSSRTAEWNHWLQLGLVLGGALTGLVLGLVHDHLAPRKS